MSVVHHTNNNAQLNKRDCNNEEEFNCEHDCISLWCYIVLRSFTFPFPFRRSRSIVCGEATAADVQYHGEPIVHSMAGFMTLSQHSRLDYDCCYVIGARHALAINVFIELPPSPAAATG